MARINAIATATLTATLTVVIMVAGNNMTAVESISYGKDGMPIELTGDDFSRARKIALADSRVQQLIADKSYVIPAYAFYSPNNGSNWYPSLTFQVGNEMQIVAAVDLEQSRIIQLTTGPVFQHQPDRVENDYDVNKFANLFLMMGVGVAIAAGSFAVLWLRTRQKVTPQ